MDKLLNAVKDFASIKRYLEAINQTTDDFLYMYDIPNNRFQIFGHICDVFQIDGTGNQIRELKEILSIVHHADRGAFSADMEQIRLGTKESHDLNFRMCNVRGETVWVNSRGKVMHDETGAPYVMIGRLSEEALRHLFNPLTGRWNKTKLRADLESKFHGQKGWLMMLGIPSLASINLSHGRTFGDRLLCELAELSETIGGIEESYHLDNNNFAFVIDDCDRETVEQIYGQIDQAMQGKCAILAGVVPIDSNIFHSVSQLIDSANVTLQTAIQNATDRVVFFSADEIRQKIGEQILLEELKESVQNNFEGFEVHYQPQIKTGSYELHGIEALLRYNSPKRGRIFPDAFIPILEQSGLIEPVGMWVLSQALAQCKQWRACLPELSVSVNFSSRQFDDYRLGEKIIDALDHAGLPGSALTVELTESMQLSENTHFLSIIKLIKAYGVRFSIDDFGTGYSNLGYLKQMDVSEIKIDRSFVSDIEKDTYNYRLISNVIEFAAANTIHTCCEGVETAKELSILEPLQPNFFQGYLFDKPCTAEELERKYLHGFSDEYKARLEAIEKIFRYKEEFGTFHFNPENILRENNIGLWSIRIDRKKNRYELHANDMMEHVLGLDQKLSSTECFTYWFSRICPEYVDSVRQVMETMVREGKAVEQEYAWNHPTLGRVLVRSSGIRIQDANEIVMLEGYHRILTNI